MAIAASLIRDRSPDAVLARRGRRPGERPLTAGVSILRPSSPRYNSEMPTAYTLAAARTALQTLTSLRSVTGRTKEVRDLNAAIDAAIREAERLLAETARRPEQVARRFGEAE